MPSNFIMHIYYVYIYLLLLFIHIYYLNIVFIYHNIANNSYFSTGIIMRYDKLPIVKEHSFFLFSKIN